MLNKEQSAQVSDPEINSGQAPQVMIVVMQLSSKTLIAHFTLHTVL